MKKKNVNTNRRFIILITVVAFAITLAFLITGGYIKAGYDVKIDEPSAVKIKASRQIENKVATERMRDEAESSIQPLFRKYPQIEIEIWQKLTHYFDEIERLRKENMPIFNPSKLPDASKEEEGEDGEEYVAPAEEEPDGSLPVVALIGGGSGERTGNNTGNNTGTNSNPVQSAFGTQTHQDTMKSRIEESFLSENFGYEDILFVVELDTSTYNQFRTLVSETLMNTLDAGVKEEGLAKALVDMKSEYEKVYNTEDSNIAQAAYEVSAAYMLPNFLYDEEATLKLKTERRAEVETLYYLPGQTIVDEGAIITEEAYVAMESLGLISKGIEESIIPIVGIVGVLAFVFFFSYLYIYYYFNKLLDNKKEMFMLLVIYLVIITAARLMSAGSVWVFVPVLIFALLVALLLDIRTSIVLNIGVTVITMLITNSGLDYLLFFILVGTLAAISAKYANQRNNVFFVSLIISLASSLVYIFVSLTFEKEFSASSALWAVYAFLNGILTVMLVMGSLPIWEALFGVITQIKLLDLTNPDNELLRRLTIEAPGTYHHSLIVANLAETAAYDIGADPNIARVGGYYHDIGKLKYPQYYSENQVSENLHDELDPYSSVAVITSHIAVGLQMADENKLPKVIKDIIAEHHGSTLIKYFYHKAKTENPEDDIADSDFRYKQNPPRSREAAVVMLADTVEAAVRSMFSKSKSMDEIDAFTRELIKDKLDDNQLIDSGLTIKDMDTVAKSFMKVFKGMYHERIPYPKMEKKEKE